MIKLFSLLLIIASLTSCWPTSIAFRDKSVPPEWKKFNIVTLENNAANTPLSYAANLSENLKDGVQNNTSLLLATGSDSSEINIEGQITNYSILPIALQEGDFASKNRLKITVSFQIYISKPEEETREFSSSRFIDYDAATDLAIVESDLLQEVNDQIVQDLINKLLANW